MGATAALAGVKDDLHEEEQICPLCINELDETEKAWLPCSCGYQLCLFCYDRLKTEFSNQCPNCRVEYDSDFQAGLRRRQERVAQLQKEAAVQRETAAKAAAAAAVARPHVQPPPPPPPRVARLPQSPRHDLQIEQEQLWPSLGAAAAATAQSHHPQQQAAAQQQQQQHQQQQQQPPPPAPGEPAGSRRVGSPLQARLAPILAGPSLPAEPEASSSSSADTAATTPQSPVSSVVSFRAVQAPAGPPGFPTIPGILPGMPGAVAVDVAAAAAVHGRCAVVLQRNGSGLGTEPDPEGASLAASLQEAVRAGSLSVKQAAASLASYLRQRQRATAAAAVSAAVAGSASSSPARGARQPSSAGSSGGTPFSMPSASGSMLSSEHSMLTPCDSAATNPSLSHWAPGSLSPSSSLPVSMPQAAQHGVGSGPALWQQQQQQLAGSPVRDNDRLPLFMRRGTLPRGASLAGGGGSSAGSPSSADSQASSSAGSGSFPGFPSRSASPTQELKRIIAPPPGFGPPLGSTGIAALPRFR